MLKNHSKDLQKMIAESKSNGNSTEVERLQNILDRVEDALRNKTEVRRFVNLKLNDRNDVKVINELSINTKFQKATTRNNRKNSA